MGCHSHREMGMSSGRSCRVIAEGETLRLIGVQNRYCVDRYLPEHNSISNVRQFIRLHGNAPAKLSRKRESSTVIMDVIVVSINLMFMEFDEKIEVLPEKEQGFVGLSELPERDTQICWDRRRLVGHPS